MTALELIIVLIGLGVLLWAVNTYILIDNKIKAVLSIVVAIAVVLWLHASGVQPGSPDSIYTVVGTSVICWCLFAFSRRRSVKGLGAGQAGMFKRDNPAECIFISYRREDTAGFARALSNELATRFKRSHVFMDVDTIEPGLDFVQVIEKAMVSCRVLLVLIGRHWSIERLSQPGDYIRAEIAEGLKQSSVRVVPVLVDGATMPNGDELPADLAPLIRRNAVMLSHDRFQSDIEKIAKVIRTDRRL